MSRSWARGSTHAWRRTRADILASNAHEHRGACQLNVGTMCQRHGHACPGICTGTANAVHHARGKAHGDDPRYLVPCCKACNSHVGAVGAISPAPRPASRW